MFLFSGNPLICNCRIMWLKSWLSEATSVGPKCADGTYVKGMPFSRNDCAHTHTADEDLRSCVALENEALLPNLATSQVFSTMDKIKDYTTQIKNNYHINKINRPSPEESEYFYDEYVDYPYNETLIDGLNEISQNKNKSHYTPGDTPTLYAEMKNTTNKNAASTANPPSSGFTFFGMPLPPINMGQLLNTGRKVDWPENKNQNSANKYQIQETPKFETGGFSPMLPTTTSGFKPITNPNMTISHTIAGSMGDEKYSAKGSVQQSIVEVSTKAPTNTVQRNTTHQKMKSEIHELQAYLNDDNSTHVAYNRTKNIEEQKIEPNNISKYNLMESNLTVNHVTEKEGILITTDTSNDLSLQTWLETSTTPFTMSNAVTSKPPSKKHIENQPTALSAILVPNNEELARRNYTKRPATVTKVSMPHAEHYDNQDNYLPVINREAKTRFSELSNIGNTKTRQADDRDWYYKNYNNSNLEPYIAPGVHNSQGNLVVINISVVLIGLCIICKFS